MSILDHFLPALNNGGYCDVIVKGECASMLRKELGDLVSERDDLRSDNKILRGLLQKWIDWSGGEIAGVALIDLRADSIATLGEKQR